AFEDDERLVAARRLQTIGRIDAGESAADDDDIEMFWRHGAPLAQRYAHFRLMPYATGASLLSAARCAMRAMNAAARSADVISIICPPPSISSRSSPATFAASPLPCTCGSRIRSSAP